MVHILSLDVSTYYRIQVATPSEQRLYIIIFLFFFMEVIQLFVTESWLPSHDCTGDVLLCGCSNISGTWWKGRTGIFMIRFWSVLYLMKQLIGSYIKISAWLHPQSPSVYRLGQSLLYGSHPSVFITKQTTLIRSHTTQVYFKSVGYPYIHATCT